LGVKAFDVPMDRKKFKGKLEEIEGKSAELE
jgi:predicted RNA-binding protein